MMMWIMTGEPEKNCCRAGNQIEEIYALQGWHLFHPPIEEMIDKSIISSKSADVLSTDNQN